MIIYNIEPTKDIPSYSLGTVASHLGVSNSAIHSLVKSSMKYIAYGCKKGVQSQHLFIPENSAWRIINDAIAGKVLKRATRVIQ